MDNPIVVLLLCVIAAVVLGMAITLVSLWRGNAGVMAETAKWGRALRGGFDARRDEAAKIDELHQLVSRLPSPPDDDPPTAPSPPGPPA